MKRSFTLLELVIVVLLISIVYFLLFSSFSFSKKEKDNLRIENLKNYLFDNFKYENSLSLYCIEEDKLPCYISIDGKLKDDIKITNLFLETPEVYNYDRDLSTKEFEDIRINEEDFNVFFKLDFNNEKKHENLVLDMGNKAYLFSSISNKIEVFEDTNSILDGFISKEEEVKDAF